MSDERRRSTASLEAPERKGVEDPGAHELGEFVCFQRLPHDPAALDKRKKKPPKKHMITNYGRLLGYLVTIALAHRRGIGGRVPQDARRAP